MLTPCCCFTGHRKVPASDLQTLPGRLEALLLRLYAEGIHDFYCGGALGFDMLAEEAVLRLRSRVPRIQLHLILPCANQDEKWSPDAQEKYAWLLEQADDVEYVAKSYTPGCLLERNRRMVDYTTVCAAYMTHSTGGTAYTVQYARERGHAVILI